MKKRFFSILLSLALCLGMLPTASFAQEGGSDICPNHLKHDDACGYVEAEPCGHACELCANKDSGFTLGTSGDGQQEIWR